MKRIKPIFFILGVVLALSSSACSPTSDAVHSGFLSDYSKLKTDSGHPGSSDWIDQSAPLRKYNAMIIDPVTIRLSSELVDNGAQPDPELLNKVLVYLHNALEREFSKQVKIVKQPGDNVLHYRAAITGITTEGGVTSSAANVLPAVFALRTVAGMNAVRAHLFMESEYSDSLTGTPLAAVMQSAVGSSVSGGDAGITVDHLKGVLDGWAIKAAQKLGDTLK